MRKTTKLDRFPKTCCFGFLVPLVGNETVTYNTASNLGQLMDWVSCFLLFYHLLIWSLILLTTDPMVRVHSNYAVHLVTTALEATCRSWEERETLSRMRQLMWLPSSHSGIGACDSAPLDFDIGRSEEHRTCCNSASHTTPFADFLRASPLLNHQQTGTAYVSKIIENFNSALEKRTCKRAWQVRCFLLPLLLPSPGGRRIHAFVLKQTKGEGTSSSKVHPVTWKEKSYPALASSN